MRYVRPSNDMISEAIHCHGLSGTSQDMTGSVGCFPGVDAHTPQVST